MQTWYEAVCKKHRERCTIFRAVGINNIVVNSYEPGDASAFLELHYGCELELAWRDDQLDKLNDEGILMHSGDRKNIKNILIT